MTIVFRFALTWLLCATALALSFSSALADRRVALIVGNSRYANESLGLTNPHNDAQDVSGVLTGLGFEVITVLDASKRDMDLALQRFARAAIDADSALFFYAGHALQYQGRNYLMPTDAELVDEISLRYQLVPIEDIRDALERSSGVKIMILDACRNNPVADRFRRRVSGRARDLGNVRGLARIDRTQGMVIAYATAADDVAMDGTGRNSPYTSALLGRMQEPGLEIEMMFRRVTADVNTRTNGRQRPETYISLLSEYYLNTMDRIVWDRVKDSSDIAALREFMTRFPTSALVLDAQHKVDVLERLARERQADREKAEREAAARLREEEERRTKTAAAERESAEREVAARLREQEERRAQAAAAAREKTEREAAARQREEEDRRAKAAAAERERAEREVAARLREQEERRAQAAAKEREKAEHEAAARKVEEERQAKIAAAAREKAEREAAARKADEERQAKIAAVAREKAEREAAARQQQEDERRAKATAAEREKAEREAAARKNEEERQAKAAAAAREKIEREATARKIEDERRTQAAAAEREKTEGDKIALQRDQEERAKVASLEKEKIESQNAERQREEAAKLAAAENARVLSEQLCKREDMRLAFLEVAGPTAKEELVRLQQGLTCEGLRPFVLAALGKSNPPAAAPPAPVEPVKPAAVDTVALVKSAQEELLRVGCLVGKPTGSLDAPTRKALTGYASKRGFSAGEPEINDGFVSRLKAEKDRVCPLVCPQGQTAEADRCVAAPKAPRNTPVATRHREREKQATTTQRPPRSEARRAPAPEPRVRAEARAPAPTSSPRPMLGVGF